MISNSATHQQDPGIGGRWTEQKLDAFIKSLDERIDRCLREIEQSPIYVAVTDPGADPRLLRGIMREVYLEIYCYQPQVIEATIALIGRMPKSDAKMIQRMLIHQSEEVDHGEMALRDYVALGGDEAFARSVRRSPASFAVASIWWGLWRMECPFAYLGALYPFEGLTPIIADRARTALLNRGYPAKAMEFIEFHAVEDKKHANLVRKIIKHAVKTYPEAADSICTGIEYFLAVYPLPVWMTAYNRAIEKRAAVDPHGD